MIKIRKGFAVGYFVFMGIAATCNAEDAYRLLDLTSPTDEIRSLFTEASLSVQDLTFVAPGHALQQDVIDMLQEHYLKELLAGKQREQILHEMKDGFLSIKNRALDLNDVVAILSGAAVGATLGYLLGIGAAKVMFTEARQEPAQKPQVNPDQTQKQKVENNTNELNSHQTTSAVNPHVRPGDSPTFDEEFKQDLTRTRPLRLGDFSVINDRKNQDGEENSSVASQEHEENVFGANSPVRFEQNKENDIETLVIQSPVRRTPTPVIEDSKMQHNEENSSVVLQKSEEVVVNRFTSGPVDRSLTPAAEENQKEEQKSTHIYFDYNDNNGSENDDQSLQSTETVEEWRSDEEGDFYCNQQPTKSSRLVVPDTSSDESDESDAFELGSEAGEIRSTRIPSPNSASKLKRTETIPYKIDN